MIDKSKGISEIPTWFRGSRLNFAENLLRYNDDRVAVYSTGENFNSMNLNIYMYLELGKFFSEVFRGQRIFNGGRKKNHWYMANMLIYLSLRRRNEPFRPSVRWICQYLTKSVFKDASDFSNGVLNYSVLFDNFSTWWHVKNLITETPMIFTNLPIWIDEYFYHVAWELQFLYC